MRYEIENETNAIKIYYRDSDVPTIYQPTYPNGDAWQNAEDAENWAKLWIEAITNPKAPFPPDGIGLEPRPKPVIQQTENT
jgi:hypothetical protein